jgi:farnesyl-diphosphate farnesyltransferase
MEKFAIDLENPKSLNQLSDNDFQLALLEGVSRTFALTIPQLPPELFAPVANAYLLCRIVDTIEDEVSLSARQKEYFCTEFTTIVTTGENTELFAIELAPLLSNQTIAAEHTLIHVLPRVIQITHTFAPEQIAALSICVATMAKGMPAYQSMELKKGLASLKDLDLYCYYVAGCVGEMLTELFCFYSSDIAKHRNQMLALSVSFGQGLQMTNILKDIADDAQRGVCWLPQDIFTEVGFDLGSPEFDKNSAQYRAGVKKLIAIAQGHLSNALKYTQLLPKNEPGIRNFCLWAVGMAILTLRNVQKNTTSKAETPIKISRDDVKKTIFITNLFNKNNTMLDLIFNLASLGLTSSKKSAQPMSTQPNFTKFLHLKK